MPGPRWTRTRRWRAPWPWITVPSRGRCMGCHSASSDVFDTQDLPTSYGSPIYRDHRPETDAAAVTALPPGRRAGGRQDGQHGIRHVQAPLTRNPHNTAYTPGGSSSGSAAAVADFMVPFALGTQTAASVIRPAAYCGVVGFKPSYGAIPRDGIKALAPSLDTVGCFTRSVDDAGLIASVLMDQPELRRLHYDGPPRVGIYRSRNGATRCRKRARRWRRRPKRWRAPARWSRKSTCRRNTAPWCNCSRTSWPMKRRVRLPWNANGMPARSARDCRRCCKAGTQIDAARHQANLQRAAEMYARVDGWFERFERAAAAQRAGRSAVRRSGNGRPAVRPRVDAVRAAVRASALRHRAAWPARWACRR